MKEFVIYVDSCGFAEEYIVKAKDLTSAKRKAKAMAVRDFKSCLIAVKATY